MDSVYSTVDYPAISDLANEPNTRVVYELIGGNVQLNATCFSVR